MHCSFCAKNFKFINSTLLVIFPASLSIQLMVGAENIRKNPIIFHFKYFCPARVFEGTLYGILK